MILFLSSVIHLALQNVINPYKHYGTKRRKIEFSKRLEKTVFIIEVPKQIVLACPYLRYVSEPWVHQTTISHQSTTALSDRYSRALHLDLFVPDTGIKHRRLENIEVDIDFILNF